MTFFPPCFNFFPWNTKRKFFNNVLYNKMHFLEKQKEHKQNKDIYISYNIILIYLIYCINLAEKSNLHNTSWMMFIFLTPLAFFILVLNKNLQKLRFMLKKILTTTTTKCSSMKKPNVIFEYSLCNLFASQENVSYSKDILFLKN